MTEIYGLYKVCCTHFIDIRGQQFSSYKLKNDLISLVFRIFRWYVTVKRYFDLSETYNGKYPNIYLIFYMMFMSNNGRTTGSPRKCFPFRSIRVNCQVYSLIWLVCSIFIFLYNILQIIVCPIGHCILCPFSTYSI